MIDNTDIFLNRLIHFYSTNAVTLQLTSRSTPCCSTT